MRPNQICQSYCSSRQYLKTQLSTSMAEKREYRQPSYSCPDCGKTFSSEQSASRTRHLEGHGKVLFWKCGGCGEVRSSHRFADLVNHCRKRHGDWLPPEAILLPKDDLDEPEEKRMKTRSQSRSPVKTPSTRTKAPAKSVAGTSSSGRSSRPHCTSSSTQRYSGAHGSAKRGASHPSSVPRHRRSPPSAAASRPPSPPRRGSSPRRRLHVDLTPQPVKPKPKASAGARLHSVVSRVAQQMPATPSLSLSPPPTGTTLPATLPTRRSPRKSTPTRRTSERLPASVSITFEGSEDTRQASGASSSLPTLSAVARPPRLLSPLPASPEGRRKEPTASTSKQQGEAPGPSCTPTAGQTSAPSSPPPRGQSSTPQPPATSSEELTHPRERADREEGLVVQELCATLDTLSVEGRQRVRQHLAAPTTSVSLQTDMPSGVHLLWGPDRTIVVRSGVTSFRTKARTEEEEDECQ